MNCGEIRPLLSAYLDGEVTPEERRSVERHLATCEDCRHVLAEYRAIGSDLRAMPVPVPPSGLRRDVWRAIEARQGGARLVKTPPSSQGKLIALPQTRNKPSVINVITGAGNGWARVIPAAVLIGALLIAVSYFMLFNRTPVAVATMLEQGEVTDYSQAVHVLLSKAVTGADVEQNTRVYEISGKDLAEVKTSNKYSSKGPNSGELAILPADVWKAGIQYRVIIDAQRVRLSGIGNNPLDSKPIELEFGTAMYTPTPTNSPTNTPLPTDTPVPPTQTPEPPVVNTPAPTAVAQVSPEVPVVEASNTPQPPAATATKQPNTPVPPTATRPAPTTKVPPTPTQVPPSATNTVAPSNTPVPPTATNHPTQVPSATASASASATVTRKATGTPTVTGTPQPRVTPSVSPISDCLLQPVRGFGKIWRDNADVRERLGCPTVPEEGVTPAAQQHFQYGYMFWRGDTRTIYVFLLSGPHDQYGTWFEFKDTWVEGEPVPTVEGTPPDGGYVPVRGFGKVWANNPALRQKIGYATEPETSVDAVWQPFEHGMALWTSDRTIRMMYEDGIWQHFNDTFTSE